MTPAKPAAIKRQTSSGGVLFRQSKKSVEVVLVAVNPMRKKHSNGAGNKIVWCLPKGAIDKNEDFQATALREVKEETGLQGKIINEIGKISYWYYIQRENIKFNKTVYFYLMNYISGSTDDHDREVDESRWFPIGEAIDKLAYKGEKEILQKAKQMIETIFKM